MIRRIAVVLGLAGLGWYLYARFLKQQHGVYVGDQADLRPDEGRGGVTERVAQAASGAATTAMRVAQAPVTRVRSLVGHADEEQPEGERRVTPEGMAEESIAEMAAGYAPADERREPPPTPDAYRPAAEASPVASATPERGGGATLPAESSTAQSQRPQTTRVQEQPAAEAGSQRTIKGNVRADGDKIYHMPGDPAYERTNAEQMFATIDEAEAAGYRRAGRTRQD